MYNRRVSYRCGRAWDDDGTPLPGCVVPYGLGAAAEAAPLSQSDLGQIRSRSGYVYQLTPADILWLARSMHFEGGSPAATAWTYAQLAALRRSGSFTALVRSHSQPINPLWDEASDPKCIANPSFCTPEMLARRAQARSMPWSSIPVSIRSTALRWAQADLPNPVPRSVNFANERVSRSFMQRPANRGSQVVLKAGDCPRHCNWYIAEAASLGWPADFVTLHYKGRVSTVSGSVALPIAVVGGALVIGAGGFAYWAWKRSQRRR